MMHVVEVEDSESRYWIVCNSDDPVEEAKAYYVENLALDFVTEQDALDLTGRILDDHELDRNRVYDEDEPESELTFRQALFANAELEIPYVLAQTEP